MFYFLAFIPLSKSELVNGPKQADDKPPALELEPSSLDQGQNTLPIDDFVETVSHFLEPDSSFLQDKIKLTSENPQLPYERELRLLSFKLETLASSQEKSNRILQKMIEG